MKINAVLVQCNHCAYQFASRLIHFSDIQSFESTRLEDNQEPCPNCGKMAVTDRAHVAYRLEDGSVGGEGSAFRNK